MRTIETVIQRLGYDKSEKLFYLSEIDKCTDLSWHDRRVLRELAPYATYVVDGSVLTVFFDDLNNREGVDLHGKIWNAQIPVVISDEGNFIKIYNGKSMDLSVDKKIRLRDIVSYDLSQCDDKTEFSYWNVTNSLSLDHYEKSMGTKNLNDFLIDNLRFITKRLKDEYNISFSNKLMLRVLFIRYLIDRGVNIGYMGLDDNVKKSQETFLNIIQDKDEFLKLVKYLKGRFNGNLFEIDEQKEKNEITQESLAVLHDFLTAREEMKTGQLCLFPFYDFNIIPIELISNIYEILLGKEKQNKDKAFYTPEYLVDYIVDRTVGKYLIKENGCKVLDPSCGSGIFLVKSLQKILERNAETNGFLQDKDKINTLIKENIYGVDYNEEAVDVTVFSLYVTLFDYQDPKSLEDFRLPLLKNENILCGDFFDEEKMKPIEKIDFKFILGNPPWGIVNQQNYKKYCDDRNVIAQDREISVAFLLKVQEIGNPNTECSLVIPSKILYKGKSPSVALRKRLLTDTQLEQVLEISAVRKQIFKGAVAPAAVLSFLCKKCALNHKVEYISLKPNKYLKLFGVIMIESDDIKYVKQTLFLENDDLWKILVYGGYWDFEILNSIREKFRTIKDIASEHNLIMKKGLQDNDGDKKDSSHLVGRKILDSDGAVDHFFFNDNAYSIFNKNKIHRPRTPEIYNGPYVLFKKGLDCSNYSIRAVYTEKDFLYRETINCIKGKKTDKKILLNLCGLLNSTLFSYFNLMLGSSAGIEREQVFLEELAYYPYAYSDELVELVQKIQQEDCNENSNELQDKLNKSVMKMYDLQDNYFVDYVLSVQIPLLCGTYRETKCDVKMIKEYTSILSRMWDEHFGESDVHYSITIYPDIKGKFAAVQVKLSFENQMEDICVVDNVDEDVSMLTNFMIYQLNDSFYQTKNIVEFSEDSFVIVKPIEAKNWHPAMAIKDSHKVLNAVLLGKEDCI
ncbi:HsdM family class I SAM-dependent methyltransferase [Eubacterium oxidoreducens]|uniref:site-specific DNA-methyltransferase (adenine-specific) n=1 Tax=Eubacterium oxidoreducens TaxID=1732 RepID=A0A1G6BXX5_EUBOX|nr:N-6 DNA methylase [Eubacterium oxidoreducens]SDB25459.1 Type I restriction-modification system, DNA methylase subunit [Eubacterium oxidoreducens]